MDWITREIATGFQALASLSLDRQPALDVLPMTVKVWHGVITNGRKFDELLDAARFRMAFLTLAGCNEWPKPHEFLAALPGRDQLALAKTPIKADPERAARAVAEIAAILKA